MCALG